MNRETNKKHVSLPFHENDIPPPPMSATRRKEFTINSQDSASQFIDAQEELRNLRIPVAS
jgi:hypothetical protein